jgi:hypothetical protein
MNKRKLFISILLLLVFAAMQASPVLAAPLHQDPSPTPTPAPLTGTVTAIEIKTDSITGISTVLVTFTDAAGLVQTVTLSWENAVLLGLVMIDPLTSAPTVVQTAIGLPITIDPALVVPPAPETSANPVAEMIAAFFGSDPATIEAMHDDGVGFGVIAQSCFMSYQLAGDASLCDDIVTAKKSGDFSAIVLPDGTTAENWGQFKKAVSDQKGFLETLGSIVSGKADAPGTETANHPGRPDDKGKPADPGKPADNGKPDDKGKPADAGKGGKPEGKSNNGKGNGNK